ncbi:MAG: ankyrin repeat domain-containing protein [Planctomycetaceae bacterium]|jgi:ankyrin repeat protein|nr:ankyrin repeat domain-containing protein [Planctomycetaceae bacterium]
MNKQIVQKTDFLTNQKNVFNSDEIQNGLEVLFETIEQGDLDKLKNLIDSGANVNAKDEDNWTLLHCAASYNSNSSILKYLVLQGADVNAKDEDGWTALHYAASENNNVEIVEYLISQGIDGNVKNKDGSTPLHCAAKNSNASIDILKLLESHGADVNAIDQKGKTPLDYAQRTKNNKEICKYLISIGAKNTSKFNWFFKLLGF